MTDNKIQLGYFFITDITGYTIFLTKSELDHAHNIIEALFDSQLKVISSPMTVSNFQGDAILCYVPEESVTDGTALLNQMRSVYVAFQEQMDAMQVNPPCGCSACANITMLDLKMFLHYGQYLVKSLGDRVEILGSDVITAHRMMKNDVSKETGIHSYLLMTEIAFEKLKLEDRSQQVNYSQTYEHIGKLDMLVSELGQSISFKPNTDIHAAT
ncbi:DUF2652 domain-containing protein [bacterium]|nr:DUF2652 domain-containing protein [bacterium]